MYISTVCFYVSIKIWCTVKTFWSILRFVDIIWTIWLYITSQRWSVGLRSADCEGRLRTVTSVMFTEPVWALWHLNDVIAFYPEKWRSMDIFSVLKNILSVNTNDGCVGKIPARQQFVRYSDQPVWHQQQSPFFKHLSPFWWSLWAIAGYLNHVYMKCIQRNHCWFLYLQWGHCTKTSQNNAVPLEIAIVR